MTPTPKALALADALLEWVPHEGGGVGSRAAAELRRLHELNLMMLAALEDCACQSTGPDWTAEDALAFTKLRAKAAAKAARGVGMKKGQRANFKFLTEKNTELEKMADYLRNIYLQQCRNVDVLVEELQLARETYIRIGWKEDSDAVKRIDCAFAKLEGHYLGKGGAA